MSLRRVRVSTGMSQAELGARSGVRRETISKIERGVTRGPFKPATVVALAWALDVPLERLADMLDALPIGPRSSVAHLPPSSATQYIGVANMDSARSPGLREVAGGSG